MTLGFLVSATKKSSGKTIVSLGIGAALKKRGLVVQAYKKGPDYIDPNWHARATGRPCLNLDFRLQSHQEISSTFDQYRQGADVVYIEGNKGLFDGMDVEGSDSNAALARYLNLPVVLIIGRSTTVNNVYSQRIIYYVKTKKPKAAKKENLPVKNRKHLYNQEIFHENLRFC